MRRLLLLAVLLPGCVTPAQRAYDTTRAEYDAAYLACRSCAERAKDNAAVPCDAPCAQVAAVAPLLAAQSDAAGRDNLRRSKPAPQSQPAVPPTE